VKKAARKAARAVAETADTAVESAGVAPPTVKKAARKAAHAADEIEPTV
jgi:hypothetical protein